MDRHEVTKALWDEVRTWALDNFDNAGSGKAADHPVHTVMVVLNHRRNIGRRRWRAALASPPEQRKGSRNSRRPGDNRPCMLPRGKPEAGNDRCLDC
jgi:hypothetical protein